MATQDELPAFITAALDSIPWWVNAAAVIAIGGLVVLILAAWVNYINHERQATKDRHPAGTQITEFEAAAHHWHKPPVQAWANEPQEDKTA